MQVTRDKISAYQRPIPILFPRGCLVWTTVVKQAIVRRVKRSDESWVLCKNGDSLEWLDRGELDDADLANQIERQIETFLHVKDNDMLNDFRGHKHMPGAWTTS